MKRFTPFLMLIVVLGCEAKPSQPLPPKTVNASTASLKELQQGTAQTAVAAGAAAGQQSLTAIAVNTPEVKSVEAAKPVKVIEVTVNREAVTPAASSPPIRVANIRSDKPQATREKALSDAIQIAQYRIQEQLLQLDPPVQAKPSLVTIRNEYLKPNTVKEEFPPESLREKWRADKLDPNRMWVTIDVELTEQQVKTLRASDRVTDGFRGAALVFALIAAVFGFLRLDAFTKGYLTWWLAIVAMVIAVAAAVLVVW